MKLIYYSLITKNYEELSRNSNDGFYNLLLKLNSYEAIVLDEMMGVF